MKTSALENLATPQATQERETPPAVPDVGIETEMSNEQLEKSAANADTYIEQEAAGVSSEAEQNIEASTGSLNLSPETIQTARQEQGLDAQLGDLQGEASQIADKAKLEIKAVTAETPVASEGPVVAEETVEATEEKPKLSEVEATQENKETKEIPKTLEQNEQEYLSKKLDKAKGLDGRYADERSSAEHIQKQIAEYVAASGVKQESIPELENQKFGPETKKLIQDKIKSNLDGAVSQ